MIKRLSNHHRWSNYLKSATLNDLKMLFNFDMDSKDKAVIILVGLSMLK